MKLCKSALSRCLCLGELVFALVGPIPLLSMALASPLPPGPAIGTSISTALFLASNSSLKFSTWTTARALMSFISEMRCCCCDCNRLVSCLSSSSSLVFRRKSHWSASCVPRIPIFSILSPFTFPLNFSLSCSTILRWLVTCCNLASKRLNNFWSLTKCCMGFLDSTRCISTCSSSSASWRSICCSFRPWWVILLEKATCWA
mmetsp:Transcript_20571/g.27108  ORF Transcript_20571/g.27108 Transcript_20571/m.27108 type:complete len:202 (-) Transcript_20571:799-1404(-)